MSKLNGTNVSNAARAPVVVDDIVDALFGVNLPIASLPLSGGENLYVIQDGEMRKINASALGGNGGSGALVDTSTLGQTLALTDNTDGFDDPGLVLGTASGQSVNLSSVIDVYGGEAYWIFKTANGVSGAPLAVTNGQTLGGVSYLAYNGTDHIAAFSIEVAAVGDAPGSTATSFDVRNETSKMGFHLLSDDSFTVDISLNVANASGTTGPGDVNISGEFKRNGITQISVGTPVSSTDVGFHGQIKMDGSFAYFCVADNTWVRSALETW